MTDPLFTACEFCRWQVEAVSDLDKAKKEQNHMERWHADIPPQTDELCEQLVKLHASEHDVVVQAIETSARMNGGLVDPNEVRGLIPPGVTPQLVGAVYRVMRKNGTLEPVDENVSTDTHGRNAGKKQTVYRLVNTGVGRTA